MQGESSMKDGDRFLMKLRESMLKAEMSRRYLEARLGSEYKPDWLYWREYKIIGRN